MSDMNGRIVLVTGGSRGIGAGTAEAFAKQGAKVAVVGRDRAALDAVAAKINGLACVADCTKANELADAVARTEKELGAIDVLLAFAGGGDNTPTTSLSEEKWRSVLDNNVTSTFLTIQAVLPRMVERRRGAIVTMSSSAGRAPGQASLAYAVAKSGVVMMTQHLAKEFGASGVRVNCIAPSAIMTERMRARIPDDVKEQMRAQFPLGRIGEISDVAQAALYLASASWVTGVALDVAGGRIIV